MLATAMFPARAGMNPGLRGSSSLWLHVPRASGDEQRGEPPPGDSPLSYTINPRHHRQSGQYSLHPHPKT